MAVLKADGWFLHNLRGSPYQFKHLIKTGKVTVPLALLHGESRSGFLNTAAVEFMANND